MSEVKAEKPNEEPILKCPHCEEYIIIEKQNCGIFRHGSFKINGIQINSHAPKAECDFYINRSVNILLSYQSSFSSWYHHKIQAVHHRFRQYNKPQYPYLELIILTEPQFFYPMLVNQLMLKL